MMMAGLLVVVVGLCRVLLVCGVMTLRMNTQGMVIICVSEMSFRCLTMSCAGMFMSDRCGSVCVVGVVVGLDHMFC